MEKEIEMMGKENGVEEGIGEGGYVADGGQWCTGESVLGW